ncbi:GtrA family protein [Ferviditalea candida]|uniref:GtrA family protein n=1 Tax=Ferviditalea candida TaxID=3108399 RepID=A0ABU5ZKT6_9BACL|nr:GtrA family protein [Paenibacillaceae bacterium T2]
MRTTEQTAKIKRELARFVKFNAVGLINTGVDFAVFALLNAAGLNVYFAQAVSYSAGIANSFLLNRVWTFQYREKPGWGEALRFLSVNLTSFAVSTAALYALHALLGVHALAAKLVTLTVSVLLNYFGYKHLVFAPERHNPAFAAARRPDEAEAHGPNKTASH